MAIVRTENVLVDDAQLTLTEEVYTDDQTGQVVARGYLDPVWKPGTEEYNQQQIGSKLDDPAVQARLAAIRTRMQEIRDPNVAFTNNTRDRAIRDTADALNDLTRIVINVLKEQRQDYSDAGA